MRIPNRSTGSVSTKLQCGETLKKSFCDLYEADIRFQASTVLWTSFLEILSSALIKTNAKRIGVVVVKGFCDNGEVFHGVWILHVRVDKSRKNCYINNRKKTVTQNENGKPYWIVNTKTHTSSDFQPNLPSSVAGSFQARNMCSHRTTNTLIWVLKDPGPRNCFTSNCSTRKGPWLADSKVTERILWPNSKQFFRIDYLIKFLLSSFMEWRWRNIS